MNNNFLKIAKQAALEAGKIIEKYSGKEHQKTLKHEDKSDFATEADLESERLIVKALTQNFPTHNIIAEEASKMNKGSEYTWLIDPLDGTISYAKGQGAYLNGKPISVSTQPDLEAAAVDMDFGHRARRRQKLESYIITLANKMGYLYAFAPAAGILGLVSKGSLDAYVATAWIWDFAAGVVIVKEAGGKITDFEGKEPDWSKDRLNIVASNGLIHDQILEALKK